MDDLDTPNCPNDLVRMEPQERRSVIVWVCPECQLVMI